MRTIRHRLLLTALVSAIVPRMGLPRVDTLRDLTRLGADLEVTCRRCGHARTLSASRIIKLFAKRGWSLAWSAAPARFRCDRCGAKEVSLDMAPGEGWLTPDGSRRTRKE